MFQGGENWEDDPAVMTAHNGDLDDPPSPTIPIPDEQEVVQEGNLKRNIRAKQNVIAIDDGSSESEAADTPHVRAHKRAASPEPGTSGAVPGRLPSRNSGANKKEKKEENHEDNRSQRNKLLAEVKASFDRQAQRRDQTPNERWGALFGLEIDDLPQKRQETFRFYAQNLLIGAKRGIYIIPEVDDVLRGNWQVKRKDGNTECSDNDN